MWELVAASVSLFSNAHRKIAERVFVGIPNEAGVSSVEGNAAVPFLRLPIRWDLRIICTFSKRLKSTENKVRLSIADYRKILMREDG